MVIFMNIYDNLSKSTYVRINKICSGQAVEFSKIVANIFVGTNQTKAEKATEILLS